MQSKENMEEIVNKYPVGMSYTDIDRHIYVQLIKCVSYTDIDRHIYVQLIKCV